MKNVFDLLLAVVKLIAIGAGGLGFKSLAGEIGRGLPNGSSPLRRFFGDVLPGRSAAAMGPVTRYTLRCGPRHSLHASMWAPSLVTRFDVGPVTRYTL